LRHADSQRDRASRPPRQFLPDFAGEHIQIDRGQAQMAEDLGRGVDGKVVARIQEQAAIRASTPTSDSAIMAPYPMKRASLSLSSIFGVVPEATSE
jgi:hypothetical protein